MGLFSDPNEAVRKENLKNMEDKRLRFAEACAKDEAVFIMVRTVMNFIYRAGIPVISAEDDAADESFIKSLGFRRHDDEWQIDLKKFYRSPCHYQPDEENA